MKSQSRAAVIGSGVGGLAAAIRLQAQGVPTTIYEKMSSLGGRAHQFSLGEYKFDSGPTVITVPACLEDLFNLCGKKMSDYVELESLTPFYRLLWEDGDVFDYNADSAQLEKQMAKYGESEWQGYLDYIRYAEEVYKRGYLDLSHVNFSSFWSMMKVAPDLLRLSAQTPIYKTVSKFVKSERLRQILSFNTLLIGGNPFKVSSIYSLIHPLEKKFGVHYAKGGMGKVVSSLQKIFEEAGGQVMLGAEVDRIKTKNNKIEGLTLTSGKSFDHETIVCNSDMIEAYGRMLRGDIDGQKQSNRWKKKHFSMSLFVYYFGTNRDFPGLKHHNIIFGSRYKDLLTDIFDKGIVPEDFSLYLYAPSKNDSSMAPKGCSSFYVLSPVAHLGKSQEEWDSFGPKYRDRVVAYLEKHYMPGLAQSIQVDKFFTPKDFQTTYNSHNGSAFSIEPRLNQSAYFRLQNRDKRFKGLFFVGASTHPGAGLPGVIDSAKATTDMIVTQQNPMPYWKDGLSR